MLKHFPYNVTQHFSNDNAHCSPQKREMDRDICTNISYIKKPKISSHMQL